MLKDYLSKLLALALVVFACAYTSAQNVTVTAPGSVAGDYPSIQAAFGPFANGESGMVMEIDDGMGATTGCVATAQDMSNTIALIDRGACGFVNKAAFAEAAGAIGVVICNSLVDFPDSIIVMGGNDGCALSIPAVMMSYGDCQTIRAELGNGLAVTLPSNAPAIGDAIGAEEALPGAGTYSAATLVGPSVLADSDSARYYTITAPMDAVMNVNSCLGGVDTRVTVLEGCRNNLFVVGQNDDACELTAGGDEWASSLDVIVYGGQEYIIMWDNPWSVEGFDFEVSFSDLPLIDVTFNVDMQNETVAADGVYIMGTPTGGVETAMTDNGDGTWSWTVEGAPAGSFHTWMYLNGSGNAEDAAGLEACGVDNGAGGFIRAATLNTLEDIELGTVCYASCNACPTDVPTDCADPFEIIIDDIESYTVDFLGPQAEHWSTWSGTVGGAEDLEVTTEQASSGTQSVKITGGGTQDGILLLGEQTTGHYLVSWEMYIEEGNVGYYNLQHLEEFGGANGEWACEIFFNADGVGDAMIGGNNFAFDWEADTWMDIVHYIDLDNNWATLYINNSYVYGWPFNWQAGEQDGVLSLGAVNFYPSTANSIYYVDNINYSQIPPAADGNGYCHVATPIDLGTHTMTGAECWGGPDQENAPLAAWYAYTAAEDGFCFITSCEAGSDSRVWIFNSCDMRGTVGVNDDECAVVTGGADLYASYKEFAVTAGETYYIAWDNRWLADGETHDFALGFFADEFAGDFCQTAIDIDLGTHSFDTWGWASQSGPEYGALGDNTPYTISKWFTYTPTEDKLVRLYSCDLAVQDTRAWIYTGECGTYESMQLVVGLDNECGTQEDFTWDAVAGTTYYIEWDDKGENIEGHEFALEEVVLDLVSVTYQVDMTWVLDAGGSIETIKIAGNFATNDAVDMVDWDPVQSPAFTDIGDDIYEVTIDYLASSAGQTQEYKFLNTPDSWGACGVENECFDADSGDCTTGSGDFNRVLTIPSEDMTVCFTWEQCVGCNLPNSTREALIDIPMTIAPNPFSQEAIVTFNEAIFEAEASLTTLTGQVARTYQVNGSQLVIEKEDLKPGVYFFTVTTADGVSTAEKLIVQ